MTEADFLHFTDMKDSLEKEDSGHWTTLYKLEKDESHDFCMFSCLLKKENIKECLKDPSWDLDLTGTQKSDNAIKILIRRGFYGIRPDYWEITEDIRLFFNLFEDKENNKFILIDDDGEEEEVIEIKESEVRIKKSFLKEYLFAKNLVLVQLYDFFRFSSKTLEELGVSPLTRDMVSGDIFSYSIGINNHQMDSSRSVSLVIGKKIIDVSNTFKSGYSTEKKYEEFYIGVDQDGKSTSFTCDESLLANYFGKNKENPHYLTPVFFTKDVLDKYYNNPSKYSVSDGYLSCGCLWGLRMDNSHKDIVMVFLGDLGHLSNKEQRYWKTYNVPDGKMSVTCFKRSFEAEFCDPDVADLFFKQKFQEFQSEWYKKHQWYLFLPLQKDDKHCFETLRIPTKETQQEFDQVVLALSKIMIDSLNEGKLKEGLVSESSPSKKLIKNDLIVKNDDKGIEIFRKYLGQKYNLDFPLMISFMRDLQNLRSSGSAHRKGDRYEKTKKKLDLTNNYRDVFEKILIDAIKILNTLSNKKYGLL